jgi:phospholipase C
MAHTSVKDPARHDYLISRNPADNRYGVWRIDAETDSQDWLKPITVSPEARFDATHQIVPIGRYLLEWGPITLQAYQPCFPYRLFEFDPESPDPLAGKTVQKGLWTKTKFWKYRPDFGNPEGAHEGYDSGQSLMLIPLGSFVLNLIPTEGRGTFQLWNFDPNPKAPGRSDPLPSPYTPQGSFDDIQYGHELIPLGNHVLDREVANGRYRLWSFDPQADLPLAQPVIQQGQWQDIDASHQLIPIGDRVLDWVPATGQYRLWQFDPDSPDPLSGPLRSGVMPAGFDPQTILTGIQPLIPIDPIRSQQPGSIDFMRSKIKHVVYYMVENRSFDHVCGWLYDKGEKGMHFLGRDGPFDGASLAMTNPDPGAKGGDRQVALYKYLDGKLDDSKPLDFLPNDPYHDKSDVLRQLYYRNSQGYANGTTPTMDGFVWNNGDDAVMGTYTPEQLPVLNGLARAFSLSDAWFCGMPGPTDPNRAMAFTGSTLGQLNNFQNGPQYIDWPSSPHRPSMWKTLWAHGFTDWKIYNSVEWLGFVHTYQLYLKGQIPSVDAHPASYIAGIEQFKQDALSGQLPAFSFLEPVWIAKDGTTSYHPGADLVPGERALNEIYETLKASPAWNETLLVITFDEHGGIFDHVPPPKARNPWPNDEIDGFRFDRLGVRVPTLLVSPWIDRKTVFRSTTDVAYDATSFMATLLQWFGIPRSNWWMGDRAQHAPSFEGVLRRKTPRRDRPVFDPPHDSQFPADGSSPDNVALHDLHRLMLPRLVWSLIGHNVSPTRAQQLSHELLAQADDLQSLHRLLQTLVREHG